MICRCYRWEGLRPSTISISPSILGWRRPRACLHARFNQQVAPLSGYVDKRAVHQTSSNCDAWLQPEPIQKEEEDEEEEEMGGGEGGIEELPCGCALPHIADAALERLGGVPERAHAAVPVPVVHCLFGLSFWP